MTAELFLIGNKKLRPERSVNQGDAGQVLKASAAKSRNLAVRRRLNEGTCDYMAQLACKTDFVVVNVAGSFRNPGKTHGAHQGTHHFKVFFSIIILGNQDIVVIYKKLRIGGGVTFLFTAGHRVPDDKINVLPQN